VEKLRVDHIHLKTRDVEKTSVWYCDCFNGNITYKGQFRGSDVCYVSIQSFNIVVYGLMEGEKDVSASSPKSRFGIDHFGFEVPDLKTLVDFLQTKNVKIIEEPWTVRPGVHMAYVEGPDNVRIELVQRDG
jgi:catechol 2,3-dioxygenase-like lactoylglutathione lyase family enzyme